MKNKTKCDRIFMYGAIILGVAIILLTAILIINKKGINKEKSEPIEILSRLDKHATNKQELWTRYTDETVVKDDVNDNISIKESLPLDDKGFVIIFKNLNKDTLDITITVNFKDARGNVVKSYNDWLVLVEGAKDFVSVVSSSYVPDSYESYDVVWKAVEPSSYKSKHKFSDLTINTSDDGKNIHALIENKNDDQSYYLSKLCIAYYYNDTIKRIDCVNSINVEKKETSDIKFHSYYFDKKYRGFDFDNYSVFINSIM